MREIKFRAYQPSAKGDLKWWSWQELMASDLNTIFRHPERYHLMQYTGLKDKNGVEIYEGDICNCREYECFGKIEWNEDNAGFYFYVVVEGGGFDEERLYEYADELEVIGNIYENPELLAGVSDSQLYKQAGNAVTVTVVYEIAKRLG